MLYRQKKKTRKVNELGWPTPLWTSCYTSYLLYKDLFSTCWPCQVLEQMSFCIFDIFVSSKTFLKRRKCNRLFWFEGNSVQIGGVDPNIQYSSNFLNYPSYKSRIIWRGQLRIAKCVTYRYCTLNTYLKHFPGVVALYPVFLPIWVVVFKSVQSPEEAKKGK